MLLLLLWIKRNIKSCVVKKKKVIECEIILVLANFTCVNTTDSAKNFKKKILNKRNKVREFRT